MSIDLIDKLINSRIDFASKVQDYIKHTRKGELENELLVKFDRLAVVSRFVVPIVREVAPKLEHFYVELSEAEQFHVESVQPSIDKLVSLEKQLDNILVVKDYSWLGDLEKILMPRGIFHFDRFNDSGVVTKEIYELRDISNKQLEKTKQHLLQVIEDTEKLYTNYQYGQKVIKKGYYSDFFEIYDQLIPEYEKAHQLICQLESKVTSLSSLEREYRSSLHSASKQLSASFNSYSNNNSGWVEPAMKDAFEIIES
ncbi:hypothetical protein [Vibrio jasicida]|uniref:hypothetical protein n=1 Tax=Vibrio jasicida TaxID=766224 RepID=UPI00148D97DD|nr:hypothetical protein [Vibrio jasicida]NOJ17326.1 hypothetical protein [Vibrio jasicida]